MNLADWVDRFHEAGLRIELAELAARVVVRITARERTEMISAARAAGLSLRELGLAFGLTPMGARYVTEKDRPSGRTISEAAEAAITTKEQGQ